MIPEEDRPAPWLRRRHGTRHQPAAGSSPTGSPPRCESNYAPHLSITSPRHLRRSYRPHCDAFIELVRLPARAPRDGAGHRRQVYAVRGATGHLAAAADQVATHYADSDTFPTAARVVDVQRALANPLNMLPGGPTSMLTTRPAPTPKDRWCCRECEPGPGGTLQPHRLATHGRPQHVGLPARPRHRQPLEAGRRLAQGLRPRRKPHLGRLPQYRRGLAEAWPPRKPAPPHRTVLPPNSTHSSTRCSAAASAAAAGTPRFPPQPRPSAHPGPRSARCTRRLRDQIPAEAGVRSNGRRPEGGDGQPGGPQPPVADGELEAAERSGPVNNVQPSAANSNKPKQPSKKPVAPRSVRQPDDPDVYGGHLAPAIPPIVAGAAARVRHSLGGRKCPSGELHRPRGIGCRPVIGGMAAGASSPPRWDHAPNHSSAGSRQLTDSHWPWHHTEDSPCFYRLSPTHRGFLGALSKPLSGSPEGSAAHPATPARRVLSGG